MAESKKPQKSKKKISRYNTALRYSGLAFQLAFFIVIGVLLGRWLDEKMANDTPYMTALLSVLFLILGLYTSLKDLFRNDQ